MKRFILIMFSYVYVSGYVTGVQVSMGTEALGPLELEVQVLWAVWWKPD